MQVTFYAPGLAYSVDSILLFQKEDGLPRQVAEAYGETLLALPLLRTAFPLLRPGW